MIGAALAVGAHLPNLVSLARLGLAPVILWLVLESRYGEAFWLLLVAGVTDAIDGVLARMLKAQSFLGTMLDPIADKVLLVGLFVTLGWQGLLPWWLVGLAVARDLAIVTGAGLLYWWRSPGTVPHPSTVSKVNTVLQMLLSATVLAVHGFAVGVAWPVEVLVYATAATTVVSGTGYALTVGMRLIRPAAAP